MHTSKMIIKITAFIELIIGLSTTLGLITYTVLSLSTKPLNVFIFVAISATVSGIIGLALLNYREWARGLLIFFSGYILLTKIMLLSGLLQFSGEMFTLIPSGLKNGISILYHSFIILFFTRETVKECFRK